MESDNLITGREFGVVLLKAMGVNPHRVASFTLACDPKEAVRLHVERFVTQQAADGLTEALEGSMVTEHYDVNKED